MALEYPTCTDINKLTPADVNTDADHSFDVRITALEAASEASESDASESDDSG